MSPAAKIKPVDLPHGATARDALERVGGPPHALCSVLKWHAESGHALVAIECSCGTTVRAIHTSALVNALRNVAPR